MISKEIIDRLGLIPTDAQTGDSFVYNEIIYQYGKPEDKIFVMSCDVHSGRPLHDNTIAFVNKNTNRDGRISLEFLTADKDLSYFDHVVKYVHKRRRPYFF